MRGKLQIVDAIAKTLVQVVMTSYKFPISGWRNIAQHRMLSKSNEFVSRVFHDITILIFGLLC